MHARACFGMSASVRPRLHYAWIILAVTFLTLLASAGVRAAPGVLIIPLEQEFHWTRATISFAISINILLYGLMGPFAGALMQRFGVRRTTHDRDGDARRRRGVRDAGALRRGS